MIFSAPARRFCAVCGAREYSVDESGLSRRKAVFVLSAARALILAIPPRLGLCRLLF